MCIRDRLRKYSYFFPKPLDVKAMEKAAQMLIGIHDFKAFMASGSQVKSTVRHIHRLEVLRSGDVVKLVFEANGFLYNMVRIIAGTLLDVGTGKKDAAETLSIIKSKDRTQAGKTLAPQGLCLVKVIY